MPVSKRNLQLILRSLSGVSFPLAGSIVVIYTLSGQTRRVAVIATLIAIVGHVYHSTTSQRELDSNEEVAASNPFKGLDDGSDSGDSSFE
jgi:hypothetical protein